MKNCKFYWEIETQFYITHKYFTMSVLLQYFHRCLLENENKTQNKIKNEYFYCIEILW